VAEAGLLGILRCDNPTRAMKLRMNAATLKGGPPPTEIDCRRASWRV